jgi:hypothetical protein
MGKTNSVQPVSVEFYADVADCDVPVVYCEENSKIYIKSNSSWIDVAAVLGGEAFPVGSVFVSVVSTNPATLLGYGTWSAFGAGRMMRLYHRHINERDAG